MTHDLDYQGERFVFNKILIANRGEIACRIMRTATLMGIRSVAVYSDADADAMHVAMADEAVHIGAASAAHSYLNMDAVIDAATRTQAQAIHPGYGFLAENAAFADACNNAGLVFIGPPADAIRAMGSKSEAKALMAAAGVPVVPGYHGEAQEDDTFRREAERVGFPLLVKASAGGGGKGMRVVMDADGLQPALASARREALSAFGDDNLLLERFVQNGRHVEVQIFFDSHGNGVHLFERDCSVQRRYQKVIEEAPAPDLSDSMRQSMFDAALQAGRAVNYAGAGTVEMIVGTDEFFFMEMNTRLQVEHPVTEMVTGVDLVEWQLRAAAGQALPKQQSSLSCNGHAFEARLYAEDPTRGFLPAVGQLKHLEFPKASHDVRVDTGVREGDTISIHYDPMIAKVITAGPDRDTARARLVQTLAGTQVAGVVTNTEFLGALMLHPEVVAGGVDTGLLDRDGESLALARRHPLAPVLAGALWFAAREHASRPNQEADLSPWSAADGWRMNHSYTEPLVLVDRDGELVTLTICRGAKLTIEHDDKHYVVDRCDIDDNGHCSVTIDGHTMRATAVIESSNLTIFIDGLAIAYAVLDPRVGDTDSGAHAGSLRAPMPGKILACHVAVGDVVTGGQALMLMEAMKMEHTIKAPGAGTVERVCFKTGDQVDEGAELVILSEAE